MIKIPVLQLTRNYRGRIAQLVRASGLHPEGPKFES